jgi:hypothetical protein
MFALNLREEIGLSAGGKGFFIRRTGTLARRERNAGQECPSYQFVFYDRSSWKSCTIIAPGWVGAKPHRSRLAGFYTNGNSPYNAGRGKVGANVCAEFRS